MVHDWRCRGCSPSRCPSCATPTGRPSPPCSPNPPARTDHVHDQCMLLVHGGGRERSTGRGHSGTTSLPQCHAWAVSGRGSSSRVTVSRAPISATGGVAGKGRDYSAGRPCATCSISGGPRGAAARPCWPSPPPGPPRSRRPPPAQGSPPPTPTRGWSTRGWSARWSPTRWSTARGRHGARAGGAREHAPASNPPDTRAVTPPHRFAVLPLLASNMCVAFVRGSLVEPSRGTRRSAAVAGL